ncbi:MAG: UDP-N-acetylmuramate dehydrogenase [Gammaproteobacteria bacterium]|nr:UDP-N-acetylmuramate dehydrogenase [Gammaproteobacteria bacterium]
MIMAKQASQLRGRMKMAEPMTRHTSWRIGGPADKYYQPADLDDLVTFLASLPESESLSWIGLGSNLLVRDGGIRGTVIALSGMLNELSVIESSLVRAESGVAGAKVARFCANHHLVGAEFLAGIPGTVGGALAMNAGAFGGETWRIVESVETIDRHGHIRTRPASEYEIGYRKVRGHEGEWFVAAHLRLQPGESSSAKEEIRNLLARRGDTQPTQLPNAGSVFKNPDGDHAARLIEACGLKGFCIGKACVSDKHANFIINTGNARAADVEALIGHIRDTVKAEQDIDLEPEVRIIGEPADD